MLKAIKEAIKANKAELAASAAENAKLKEQLAQLQAKA